MTIVTDTSNPTLWNKLNEWWIAAGRPGWVMDAGTHYKVVQATDQDVEFHEHTSQELFDSRSITGSKPTSYSKLDG